MVVVIFSRLACATSPAPAFARVEISDHQQESGGKQLKRRDFELKFTDENGEIWLER